MAAVAAVTPTIVQKAKAQLVFRYPFFASLLMRRPLVSSRRVPIAAVDARGVIFYNPVRFETFTVDEAIFVLCHEVMHVVGMHFLRLAGRDLERWNIATDAWINDLLRQERVGTWPSKLQLVDVPDARKELVDDLYNRLPPPEKRGGSGGPGGTGGDGEEWWDLGQDTGEGDGPSATPLTPEERAALETEIKIAVTQAAHAAKMQGKLSAGLAEFAADYIASPIRWQDVLERYMSAYVTAGYTWRRPNRRFADVYLPSPAKQPSMGHVVIQIDVSGSINPTELAHYNGHLQRILAQCRPTQTDVLYVDTAVLKRETFGPDDEVTLTYYSGGGTDMEAGFRYLDTEGLTPSVVVVLTDGYTPFSTPPDVPVVWVCSTTQDIPYGDVVRFTLD